MKKGTATILFVLSFILLFIALQIFSWLYFSYVETWKFNADFETFESDFCVVREYVEKNFASEGGKWFFVSRTDTDGQTLYDPDANAYVDIPDNVSSSLEAICDHGFPDKDSGLYIIQIQGNRVSFHIENARYALVYSPNEKPTWLNSPDEQEEIRVKKINDDWYHVILAPK